MERILPSKKNHAPKASEHGIFVYLTANCYIYRADAVCVCVCVLERERDMV